MPALRRFLKYTPAVVLGLLVVAWVASWFLFWGVGILAGRFSVSAVNSTVQIICSGAHETELTGVIVQRKPIRWTARVILGHIDYVHRWPGFVSLYLPSPLLIMVFLPFAAGPFVSFRFRLWHYLVYTALVAVELAYYLRWQE
jgi:hypothetical protein